MDMQDYSKFQGVSIFDTGLIRENSRAGKILVKNGIYSLADLFSKYDNEEIDYGSDKYHRGQDRKAYHARAQVRGIIKLIRYEYLGEKNFNDEFFFEKFTGSEVFGEQSDKSLKIGYFYQNMKKLGFMDEEIICIGLALGDGRTLYDILNQETIGAWPAYGREYFEKKLGLYKKYINEKKEKEEKITQTTELGILLEEERELLLELSRLHERSTLLSNKLVEIQEQKNSLSKKEV